MSLVGIFIVGVVIGAVALVALMAFLVNSEEGRRRQARVHAEQRVRDAQAKAMLAMADATERALGGSASAQSWPSEGSASEVVEGTATTITTVED